MGRILSPAFAALQRAYDDRAEPEIADADDTDPVAASDLAMEIAGRADRAYQAGDRAAAADIHCWLDWHYFSCWAAVLHWRTSAHWMLPH